MADLIVGPAVDLVIQKVVDCLKYQYNLRSGVEGKLKKLEEVLIRIKAVAKPADDLDLDEHEDLKKWMQGLKVAAEEASDVLDEFEYLCLKRQAEGEGEGDGADEKGRRCFPLSLRSSISSLYKYATRSLSSLYKCCTRFVQSTDPLERLMSIQSKLDELASNSNQFLQLVKDRKATVQEYHIQESRNRETGSTVIEHEWVGRHDVLEEIIKKLLEEEEPVSDGTTSIPPVVAVVGHGGMGKTTLTQHIFNHTKVKTHFVDTRMWAYVSQVFDVPTITRRIIESAAPNEKFSGTESLETLQQILKKSLKNSNRFLLVLDDVWYAQNKFSMEEQWKKLCSPLAEVGGKGSKILLTSRTPEVNLLPSPLITMFTLEGLKQEECWSIIQRSAFWGHENLDSCQDLVPIGKKIALKVHGSPLAAKALGRILRNGLNLTHWTNIQNMELSKIGEDNVMPVLKLSYRHLPPHLRQCFAYCALFPKGYKFDEEMLIRMWVAHGYIRSPTKGETTEEEIGWSYFRDLLSAGFFSSVDNNVVMHDLMNDLARFVSKDEFRYIEDDRDIPETVRHLSVSTDIYLAELIKKKCNLSNLQSLLLMKVTLYDFDDNLVKDLFRQLRRVRVLDLSCCRLKQLPDDVGNLVHLRYLDILFTGIASLPESLWRLYHLQVLHKNCDVSLEKLNQLVKLRYLDSYQDLKLGWIKGLKSLQVVRAGLVVEEGRGGEISNLKALNELREKLVLRNLDYVESRAAAREADLCRKKRLKSLELCWRESSTCSPDTASEVLEGLQPPSSLEELKIHDYPGMAWPNWMGHTSLNKLENEDIEEWSGPDGRGGLSCLKVLEITRCPNLKALPTLSLTLTELKILNMGISSLPVLDDPNIRSSSSNGIISSSSKLSKLEILGCENLTSLGEGLLQNHQCLMDLVEVTIDGCMNLVSLPDRGFREFNSLKRLRIEDCPNLTWVAPNQDLDRGLLPPSLEELSICSCQSLTPSAMEYLQALPSLKKLAMQDWPALTPSALEALQGMASLKQLNIYSCPGLLLETSSTSTADDGEGMARGPFSLAIDVLNIDNPLMLIKVPVLKSLTSVHEVTISASQLVSFPPELEKWFLQNGTSLRSLQLFNAQTLQALPDLPKSLQYLLAFDTNEEFKRRYEKDIGTDWHKIRHIKYIILE